jgi:hypothetical protein
MGRKPNYQTYNLPKLIKLCEKHGFEIEKKDTYQYRVYAASHIIDFWPARMVYHRVKGEVIRSVEDYHRELDWEFNEKQVERLLLTGDFK